MVQPRSHLLRRLAACRQVAQRNGFALPLAVGSALLLLLSASSLQLLALQHRARLAQQQQRHQLEDLLASAAQQQAAVLQQTASGCLLTAAHDTWEMAAEACEINPEQLAALQQGQLEGSRYRLSAYRPQPGLDSAQLELQLLDGRPWRAAYRLTLAPAAAGASGVQITGVQEQGLRGARA